MKREQQVDTDRYQKPSKENATKKLVLVQNVDTAKTNILVVDDNQQNLITTKAVLEELGQNIILANSAREALKYLLKYDFAVILLDVDMPEINGLETARLIRSREKSSYTPIIFFSAWHKEESIVSEGYELGAVDYIFKPVNPVILRSKVRVFVDLFTKSTLAVNLHSELNKRILAEQNALKQKRKLQHVQVDRLNTIEEMSSALAHELNQPFTAIVNYVKGCVRRLNSGKYDVEQLITALKSAGLQAERAGAILHRIKGFIKKHKLFLEKVNIIKLIENVIALIQDDINEAQINLEIKFTQTAMPLIRLDKVQIEQTLLNLIRNGIESLQTTGSHKRILIIEVIYENLENLIINVKDNGPGINDEQKERLFDLYFTTKAKGMGIGLAICRSIIEAHGGNIMAKNNMDGGAWFQITLPISKSIQCKT